MTNNYWHQDLIVQPTYITRFIFISQQIFFNLEISFSEPKTAESIAHCGELLPRRVSYDFCYFFLFFFRIKFYMIF